MDTYTQTQADFYYFEFQVIWLYVNVSSVSLSSIFFESLNKKRSNFTPLWFYTHRNTRALLYGWRFNHDKDIALHIEHSIHVFKISNSEAFASELLKNLEEICLRYYSTLMCLECSNLLPHNNVSSVAKEY